jgi:predicted amidohydrolase
VTEALIVAVAQPPCAPHDVAGNARAHAEAVRDTRARVVVFPELSLTGYELDAAPVDPADPRLAPLTEACAETGTIALAGAPVAEGQATYIAVLALDGTRVTVAYRKMWLGDEEAARFSPGPEPAKIAVDGWRLGLAVCRDTGVPRHAAGTAALGIDAYLAGTVKHAEEAALQHERARRIAAGHRLWVAVASFAGPTGGGYDETAGRSGIWGPAGTLITGTGSGSGEATTATFDKSNMEGCVPESRLPIRVYALAGEARVGGSGGLSPRGQHCQPSTSGRRWSRLGIEDRTWVVKAVSTSATATPG